MYRNILKKTVLVKLFIWNILENIELSKINIHAVKLSFKKVFFNTCNIFYFNQQLFIKTTNKKRIFTPRV